MFNDIHGCSQLHLPKVEDVGPKGSHHHQRQLLAVLLLRTMAMQNNGQNTEEEAPDRKNIKTEVLIFQQFLNAMHESCHLVALDKPFSQRFPL